MIPQIKNEADYEIAITQIESFIKRGFNHLSGEETKELEHLSKVVAKYEKEYYPVPAPSSLSEISELKMYEKQL